LPQLPGVYLWKNDDEIIYVGKARILKDRVKSYFNRSSTDPKVAAIVSRSTDIEWIITDSEIEALVLENTLIKKHKPRYNIDLKENQRYPYLRVETDSNYPRIEVVRKVERDGAKYFGPYVEAGKMRRVLNIIETVFQLRTCKITFPVKAGTRPCLNFQIGKCAGLCAGNLSEDIYAARVRQALLFLSGKVGSLTADMEDEMIKASRGLDFERAALLRDNLEAVKKVLFRQRMTLKEISDRDIVAASVKERDACVAVFAVRDGAVSARHHFYLRLAGGESCGDVLQSFIQGHYQQGIDFPEEIMVSDEISDPDLLEQLLRKESGKSVKIILPIKGDKARLMDLCRRNGEMLLEQLIKAREEASGKINVMVEALQSELKLAQTPLRIEAYDISHIQGSDTVASRVTFVNAKPKKSLYRHYNIKTVIGVDDFASMREVVGRRIRASQDENDPLPDLIVIDGGKGQLSAAMEQFETAGIGNQPIISLAKRLEEVFVPDSQEAIMIPKKSPALFLLQQIRDEAHRFAVSFHRKKRENRAIESILDTIKGLGEAKRTMLLKTYGSVENIKVQSVDELTRNGISGKLAHEILQTLASA
ncbi:MAG: excinuclease ABC subunit UvrC, partial [Fibrobacteres bacterium]|nr:excinuclease ABC subunit UvrC [Fibrobacterota bacterium]